MVRGAALGAGLGPGRRAALGAVLGAAALLLLPPFLPHRAAGAAWAQSPRRDSARVAAPARDTLRPALQPGDSAARQDSLAQRLGALLAPLSDLSIDLSARLETKMERTQNDRCAANQLFSVGFTCKSAFVPAFDAQFGLRTSGGFADRVSVDVDYDTQREFDGSNQVAIAYRGTPTSRLQRVEVGNVFFTPPPSRFISAGIPSGNFGVQAITQFGRMQLTAIAAQQKGNVVRDQVFTLGRRTTQEQEREVEDHQIEPRRFFFTVDPERLGASYPNIDILNATQMQQLAASLPDTVRPARLRVYRLILGGQPPNPNGPRFRIIGDPLSRPGQVYELLREHIDYYVDPSLLWIALVRPLALNNERLVVAYSVRIAGRDTVLAQVGGTPDLEFTTEREQWANLLWDPQVTPQHPAFRREIRSVYRLGGEDVRRESVQLRIVAGTSADQEKPPGGTAGSYLQLFGLAQLANATTFDWENRLWPRPNDPNFLVANLPGQRIFRDQFVVFPSLEPFSRRGLARPSEVAANDTIYRTPSEYLYTPQRPQSYYRLRVKYRTDGGGSLGTIALNSVQVRPGSERLTMDGRPLVKGIDYEIDYELGRVQLLGADTLIVRERRIVARYEENPLFATVPTSIVGLSSQWKLPGGQLSLVAISQSQRTTFTRPPLGFEPQASVVAGLSANYGWQLPGLTRLLGTLPGAPDGGPGAASRAPARLDVQAEFAVSRPRQRSSQQAFVESFEGDGGVTVNLLQTQWQYSSQPALGRALLQRLGAATFDTTRATTLAYQNVGLGRDGRLVQFTFPEIDPQATLAGVGFAAAEQMLWLTLYPLGVGGLFDAAGERYRWLTGSRVPGRRWRSIHTVLGQGGSGSGIDLSRAEQLEFWTLVDTAGIRRQRNPTLILDFGDVSENSVTFAPDTLSIVSNDSTYKGKKLQGFDVLGSERDRFSRAFNADANDHGLAGDVVDSLTVFGGTPPFTAFNVATCSLGRGFQRVLGDAQDNCTVRNGRLDEEDIDQDNALNFTSGERELERVRRFIVDLSDRRTYARVGRCGVSVPDVHGAVPAGSRLCWVQVRIPFNSPDDSTGGGPLIRRVRAVRLTMVSGRQLDDQQFSLTPVARLRVVGASWLKRADQVLEGLAGARASLGGGRVIATVIGTQDRDSTRGIFYEPPPGVAEVPDDASSVFGARQLQVNERSLRLLATALPLGARAEAYFRFPEGQRNLMGYRELRLWMRGRGRGWGDGGDLQGFVKVGRDADNFYLYRTDARSGNTRDAWDPEVRVRFDRFYALRARLQAAFLEGRNAFLGCTALDSMLIARSGLPTTGRIERHAACEDGYIVYTVDPAVTPPNLAAVQELAVGMVRVDSLAGGDPPVSGDTLELWVDDIRLADVVNTTGFAGEFSATLTAGDYGSVRVGVRRRDPNFRQIGESPSFLTNDDVELSGTWRLDRFLPAWWGMALPLTVTRRASGASPEFLSRSDIPGAAVSGLRTPRTEQTTYSLSARRATPLVGPWWASIVNNVLLDGAVNALGNRTEFQDGRLRDVNVGLDFSSAGLLGGLPTATVPGAPGSGGWSIGLPWGGSAAALRLSPTLVRVTSAVVRTADTRSSFLNPAGSITDSARTVDGLQHVWRNVSSVEFQPLPSVTARWDATSVHDLRGYGDSTPNAIAAGEERSRLVGVDVGLERERSMAASVTWAPLTLPWFRPRVALGSTYSMLRDPNNRALVTRLDGREVDPRLARRLGNTQLITAATTVDPAAGLNAITDESSRWRRLGRIVRPIDVTFTRNQLAAYDGVGRTPGFGFQWGLGTIDDFRSLGGDEAASAGASSDLVVGNSLTLPGGLTLTNRLQRSDARHWNRRDVGVRALIDGEAFTYPDVSMRWSGRPRALQRIFSQLGVTARALQSRQTWTLPGTGDAVLAEGRTSRQESYPFTGAATTAWGEFGLSASYALTRRVDSLPGSVARRRSSDLAADLSKSFDLPDTWKVRNPLRFRVSWQETLTQSFVTNALADNARSRLTDNGRRAFNFNADTDVAENMTFSLQGSRVVTFDRNFNRRFVQTVVTAVFQLNFFSGPPR
jgi:hypothetical protein